MGARSGFATTLFSEDRLGSKECVCAPAGVFVLSVLSVCPVLFSESESEMCSFGVLLSSGTVKTRGL